MKKNILLISICLLIFSTLSLNAQTKVDEIKIDGTWQSIVDGQPGEGALFYRFYFSDENKLTIIKQCGGKDNIVEHKTWYKEGNQIKISSNSGAMVTEFDNSKLSVKNNNTIEYSSDKYNGIIKPYKHGLALIHWVLIVVVLIVLNEIFRRFKWATILFFVILPLFLTPLVWSQHGVTYWFKWVKIYSVVFAVIWFTLIRFTRLGNYNWVKLIAALFLAVNIAEAVSQDFSMGYWPNLMNAVAGMLNIITLFYGWKLIGPDNSKHKDMIWPGMTIFWIIAYDIWNIVYVYLNFPGSTSAQMMVILACTIPALFIKKGTWLQARAFTLAAWFMYYFTFPRFTEQLELLVPRSYNLMFIVALVSLLANLIYFVVWINMIKRKKD